jgi:hypothetical protein
MFLLHRYSASCDLADLPSCHSLVSWIYDHTYCPTPQLGECPSDGPIGKRTVFGHTGAHQWKRHEAISRDRSSRRSLEQLVNKDREGDCSSQSIERYNPLDSAWGRDCFEIGPTHIGHGLLRLRATGCDGRTIGDQPQIPGSFPPSSVCRFAWIPSRVPRLSPQQRRAYLDWLAAGRIETDMVRFNSAFLFLFLYGLERRMTWDQDTDQRLFDELLRLVKVYCRGHNLSSFKSYAFKLLHFAGYRSGRYQEILPRILDWTKPRRLRAELPTSWPACSKKENTCRQTSPLPWPPWNMPA